MFIFFFVTSMRHISQIIRETRKSIANIANKEVPTNFRIRCKSKIPTFHQKVEIKINSVVSITSLGQKRWGIVVGTKKRAGREQTRG